MHSFPLQNNALMTQVEAEAGHSGFMAAGALAANAVTPTSGAAAEVTARKDAQDEVGLAGDVATPITDDEEWGTAPSASAKVAPTQAPPVAELAKEAPPDLVEMIQKITDPGVLDAVTVVIAQRKEDLETHRKERVARLIEEAAALGFTDAAKLMSKRGAKTRRDKGTSTRPVVVKHYKLPSGETATRPGRFSNVFRDAFAKLEAQGRKLEEFEITKAQATDQAQ